GARLAIVHEDCNLSQWESPEKHRQQFLSSKNKLLSNIICHNCSGVGHLRRSCPSPHQPKVKHTHPKKPSAPDTVIICTKNGKEEMCIQILIHGITTCALLDSGARRHLLSLSDFNSFVLECRPTIQPSAAQTLCQHITADTAESTEVILGQPFLQQPSACLDYGHKEITLFGEKVPQLSFDLQAAVHVVRVGCTTILEPGCEYVVPGLSRPCHIASEVLLLSPTKAFIENHNVLVAHVVVQQQQSASLPMRTFNPGTIPVKVKRGAVAGVLQPVQVVAGKELQAAGANRANNVHEPVNPVSFSMPNHLQELYADSCDGLLDGDRRQLGQLLQRYGDVFSTGPNDLGRTSIVKYDILTTVGPPVKQPPRKMARPTQ
ncbi:hypothetical protein CRENBAI_017205, partial [Crenichthys baileyi]